MVFLSLFLAIAQAEEPTEGIVQVPAGTVLTFEKGPPQTVPGFSFLLPEAMYDKALTKAKQLAVCQPALDQATAQTLQWIDVSSKALDACTVQFASDASTVETLRQSTVELESRALAAEAQLHDARSQRNTAWAITGGLVLGAVAVTALTLSH